MQGNFVNFAYKQAVSLTTLRLRRGGYISDSCRVLSTVKERGCYDSRVPGHKGRQLYGRYGEGHGGGTIPTCLPAGPGWLLNFSHPAPARPGPAPTPKRHPSTTHLTPAALQNCLCTVMAR